MWHCWVYSVLVFTRVADLSTARRPRVPRSHQHLLNLLRLRQLPSQGVLPSTSADHKHLLCHRIPDNRSQHAPWSSTHLIPPCKYSQTEHLIACKDWPLRKGLFWAVREQWPFLTPGVLNYLVMPHWHGSNQVEQKHKSTINWHGHRARLSNQPLQTGVYLHRETKKL